MSDDFEVLGTNPSAPFSLKVHRGDGMVLLGMDWRDAEPPPNFVGFAIEYRPPNRTKFLALHNRITFATPPSNVGPSLDSSLFAPIQKFRWVHFPFDAEQLGGYRYRVPPAFMDATGRSPWASRRRSAIELRRETYPGVLNVAFTRGFVSSQAFVDRLRVRRADLDAAARSALTPGLTFVPTHPKAQEALAWMGFEARSAVLAGARRGDRRRDSGRPRHRLRPERARGGRATGAARRAR